MKTPGILIHFNSGCKQFLVKNSLIVGSKREEKESVLKYVLFESRVANALVGCFSKEIFYLVLMSSTFT